MICQLLRRLITSLRDMWIAAESARRLDLRMSAMEEAMDYYEDNYDALKSRVDEWVGIKTPTY